MFEVIGENAMIRLDYCRTNISLGLVNILAENQPNLYFSCSIILQEAKHILVILTLCATILDSQFSYPQKPPMCLDKDDPSTRYTY